MTTRADWAVGDLLGAAGVEIEAIEGPANATVMALTDDSRAVSPGACFVAVRGLSADGHRFVDAALRRGASAVVVEGDAPVAPGATVVRVRDTRRALARLAAAFHGVRLDGGCHGLEARATTPIPVVGLTGTNGKTTTAWLLRALLNATGRRAALFGTVEYDLIARRVPSPLTTPGALHLCESLRAAIDAGATHAVMEVSSHALDQHRCDGLTFSVGVFTNLTGDHLDYHKTIDQYASAKSRLFSLLPADGVAVINADDDWSELMVATCPARIVRFGLDSRYTDLHATVDAYGPRETRFSIVGRSFRLPVRCRLVGRHNVMNVLAAVAAADALGVGIAEIAAAVEALEAAPGRLERVEPADAPFSVFVDYAHSDDALLNVLSAVRPLTTGRLICVFGCGGDRDRTKRPRMAAAVARFADAAIVTSDNPRSEDPLAIIEEILPGFPRAGRCRIEVELDRRAAIEQAIGQARPGDTVLIAGKGHEDYQIIGEQRLPFDDRQVAREALEANVKTSKSQKVKTRPRVYGQQVGT